MDDPWGSPWASSEATSKHQTPTPTPPKDLLSPPPRAFFGSTSNLQVQSPWANDDGFGDWAGAEQTDVAANALDWGVWAEPPSRISQPSPRPDESMNRSSIVLPSSAATSPGLRPLPRSRASSVFRHHSPDPWAAEVSLHDNKIDPPAVDLNAPAIAAVDLHSEIIEIPSPSAQRQDVVETLEASVEDTQTKKERIKPLDDESQTWESPSSISDPRESRDLDVDSVPKAEIHDNPSRPSSTLSLGSSNEVERQDSPITSIDEDPKSRLQTTSRKASGKVQELVGLYDDLAKTIIEEPSPSRGSRERSLSQARSADDADFGDFEDAKSEYGKPASVINASSTSERPPTPKAQLDDATTQEQANEPNEHIEHETAVLQAASVSVQQIVEKFGPIRFDVDFQQVDKLFPDLPQDVDEKTSETNEVSDRIIQDNFTTISERKTWYRISRYGSMLKHDFGDEDNYHRVEWSTSHLHSDTIKIVRRWMEEDSIAGRVTVGVGKRTSVFNWDSSEAAPVDLGKVFARKASVTHSRNSSIAPQNQSPARSVQSVGSSAEARISIKSPILPPDATPGQKAIANPSFGWSSDSIKSPPISRALPTKDDGTKHEAPKSRTAPTAIKTETRTSTTIQTPIQTEVILDDEDDDWGEMVSSPRIDVHPGPTLTTQPLNNMNGNASTIPAVLANDISKVHTKDVAVTQSNNSAPKLSVSIPQSSQAPKQMSHQTGSSSAAPRVDPWPLADFSIFESLSARTPKSPRQDPWPLADFSIFESPTSGSVSNWMNSLKSKSKLGSKPRENQSVRASMDQAIETQPPLKAVLGPIEKSNPEQEQELDAIVNGIIQNLPDLSYMLH
ncbi:hypothetical protein F4781DRAFT_407018 [Annulohypoxylon bovei var. microspora]|nr:hypothetical protein F4781DRAFT_407018 [Annulohypoxylon bovei var. microspora]